MKKLINRPDAVVEEMVEGLTAVYAGLRRLPGHTDWVTCAAVAADNRTAVTGGRDRTVKVWDLLTGRLLRAITFRAGVPATVGFTPDGRVTATAADGTVRIWEIR